MGRIAGRFVLVASCLLMLAVCVSGFGWVRPQGNTTYNITQVQFINLVGPDFDSMNLNFSYAFDSLNNNLTNYQNGEFNNFSSYATNLDNNFTSYANSATNNFSSYATGLDNNLTNYQNSMQNNITNNFSYLSNIYVPYQGANQQVNVSGQTLRVGYVQADDTGQQDYAVNGRDVTIVSGSPAYPLTYAGTAKAGMLSLYTGDSVSTNGVPVDGANVNVYPGFGANSGKNGVLYVNGDTKVNNVFANNAGYFGMDGYGFNTPGFNIWADNSAGGGYYTACSDGRNLYRYVSMYPYKYINNIKVFGASYSSSSGYAYCDSGFVWNISWNNYYPANDGYRFVITYDNISSIYDNGNANDGSKSRYYDIAIDHSVYQQSFIDYSINSWNSYASNMLYPNITNNGALSLETTGQVLLTGNNPQVTIASTNTNYGVDDFSIIDYYGNKTLSYRRWDNPNESVFNVNGIISRNNVPLNQQFNTGLLSVSGTTTQLYTPYVSTSYTGGTGNLFNDAAQTYTYCYEVIPYKMQGPMRLYGPNTTTCQNVYNGQAEYFQIPITMYNWYYGGSSSPDGYRILKYTDNHYDWISSYPYQLYVDVSAPYYQVITDDGSSLSWNWNYDDLSPSIHNSISTISTGDTIINNGNLYLNGTAITDMMAGIAFNVTNDSGIHDVFTTNMTISNGKTSIDQVSNLHAPSGMSIWADSSYSSLYDGGASYVYCYVAFGYKQYDGMTWYSTSNTTTCLTTGGVVYYGMNITITPSSPLDYDGFIVTKTTDNPYDGNNNTAFNSSGYDIHSTLNFIDSSTTPSWNQYNLNRDQPNSIAMIANNNVIINGGNLYINGSPLQDFINNASVTFGIKKYNMSANGPFGTFPNMNYAGDFNGKTYYYDSSNAWYVCWNTGLAQWILTNMLCDASYYFSTTSTTPYGFYDGQDVLAGYNETLTVRSSYWNIDDAGNIKTTGTIDASNYRINGSDLSITQTNPIPDYTYAGIGAVLTRDTSGGISWQGALLYPTGQESVDHHYSILYDQSSPSAQASLDWNNRILINTNAYPFTNNVLDWEHQTLNGAWTADNFTAPTLVASQIYGNNTGNSIDLAAGIIYANNRANPMIAWTTGASGAINIENWQLKGTQGIYPYYDAATLPTNDIGTPSLRYNNLYLKGQVNAGTINTTNYVMGTNGNVTLTAQNDAGGTYTFLKSGGPGNNVIIAGVSSFNGDTLASVSPINAFVPKDSGLYRINTYTSIITPGGGTMLVNISWTDLAGRQTYNQTIPASTTGYISTSIPVWLNKSKAVNYSMTMIGGGSFEVRYSGTVEKLADS